MHLGSIGITCIMLRNMLVLMLMLMLMIMIMIMIMQL